MACLTLLLSLLATGGCQSKQAAQADSGLTPPAELGATIGALADVVKPEPVVVEGYGLVGGLAGTGSGYCPPAVRAYLKRYILTQLPNERVNIDALIDSRNTAVVALEAVIPPTPSKGDAFDVRVLLPAGSEAVSLQGGWLYKAELVVRGTFGMLTRPAATVEGPIFINSIGGGEVDLRSGYILGGGRTLYEYTAVVRLRKPDYRAAGLIRNRLNERYGPRIAEAVSPSDIEVHIPANYHRRKMAFLAMIPATFLQASNDLIDARIETYINALMKPDDREAGEVGLEAIGRQGGARLAMLLQAPEAEVRLRAGRCLLNVGDNRGLAPLRDLATDPNSPYRLQALEAIMLSAKPADALTVGQRLLRDNDSRVVLAAYEGLRELDDRAVARERIGRSFLLEQVVASSRPAIFVARSGEPRVVLFGVPLRCRDNLFVESPDQAVTLDSRAGQGFVSVIRKHPTRPGVIGPIRTTPDLADVVRALGEEPEAGSSGVLRGAGVPYSQVIAVLEQMCARQAVTARFWAGPLPKTESDLKK